jgi:hypothetical protein
VDVPLIESTAHGVVEEIPTLVAPAWYMARVSVVDVAHFGGMIDAEVTKADEEQVRVPAESVVTPFEHVSSVPSLIPPPDTYRPPAKVEVAVVEVAFNTGVAM